MQSAACNAVTFILTKYTMQFAVVYADVRQLA